MQPPAPNRYALWRATCPPVAILREGEQRPPERLLQAIWQHQRLRRDQLTTLDGQAIQVLHPGFGSVAGGPDFQNAVIRFGTGEPVGGDVEVDLSQAGWRAHGHDRNPAFRNVILHVVWEGNAAGQKMATLALKNYLDASPGELNLQLEHNAVQILPSSLLGQCCAPLRELNPTALHELLWQAAQVRLYNKAAQLRIRAQHAGWEQALWEGIFRALGYQHNVWPMQQLAEMRGRWSAGGNDLLHLQARLLGVGGLLPAGLNRVRGGGDDYLRSLWDIWWREQDEYADCLLPRSLWRFHGIRPANHPQRRLVLAAHWVRDPQFVARIETWCQAHHDGKTMVDELVRVLRIAPDNFWSWHWTTKSARLKKPQPLLGEQRVTDLAVNVVLPWLLARAHTGGNVALSAEIERRYQMWPAADDNSVLRLARQRLLGRSIRGQSGLNLACAQQGLLQIVRDYCNHSNAVCAGCDFPGLVRRWWTEISACPRGD